MTITPTLRPALLASRRRLDEGREQIRQEHLAGSPGIQVCAHLTELVDCVVLEIFEGAMADLPSAAAQFLRDNFALVALGGYGRRDLAPYSDVDLMILHSGGDEITPLAQRLLRDLFDAGLDVGQTVRTTRQACQLAMEDATIATALVEARYVAGSMRLFHHFQQSFQRRVRRRSAGLITAIDQARRDERAQYGETLYLLEPNVKRSRGGLRDIQLLRWVGFVRYGTADPNELQLLGVLTPEDQRVIQRGREFLLRLRNELHFSAGKSFDILNKTEQLRLAQLYGFSGTDAILPVEQFMQDYFRHTKAVWSIVSNIVNSSLPRVALFDFFGRLFSFRVEGDYRVGPRHIAATKRGLTKLSTDVSEVLRLADLANLHNKRIDHATWEAVRAAVRSLNGDVNLETSQRFLSLLSQPGRLGELLHRLHELGVLEKIVPAFVHARCLLQFNEYHKYTVDEHCLLAVERATEFFSDAGVLGRVYRGIKQKRTLHLALLIHDLGKGYVEDHSEVGLKIAVDVAQRLRLPLREAETLKFLVHKHLMMSHLAFRRDTSDPQLIIRFAFDVGSPEVLDMLFVLTAADISAVGPGVWNDWKAEVLADLYRRTRAHLAADTSLEETAEQRLGRRRQELRSLLAGETDDNWYERQVDALPPAYLENAPPATIAADLRALHELPTSEARANGRYLPDSRTVEFIVSTHEEITPGVFHKLTGALASQGLEILSAEINTLADGLVLDRFYVLDPDFSGEPPADRLAAVNRSLIESLQGGQGDKPAFRSLWHVGPSTAPRAAQLPTRVQADNSSSDRFTILDIFTTNRMGLLYTIARTLFELGLSVSRAKIGTYLDQVVDVFYVTDQAGRKIEDEQRLQEITARLLAAIEAA
jgi:[protein-PII] uridylyltransferase